MNVRWPALLSLGGGVLMATALAYGVVTGAGIPYQDPAPELHARERWQNRVVETWFVAGVFLLGSGLATHAHRSWRGRTAKRPRNPPAA